jgi:CheY-like chemotaxis protein
MKILLVDDDAFLRDMYATKFAEHEHEVLSADSPVTALQQLDATQDFDVVLLDMIMPGMSGVELVKEIKEKYDTFKGKCIVLSNQGQAEDIDAAKAAGADGYIIKAESIPSDVVAKIEKIVADK